MKVDCINYIDLTTNSDHVISIPKDSFDHFYIANIDNEGNETKYKKKKNDLEANFFMVRILNDDNGIINNSIRRLLTKKDIIGLRICFKDGTNQDFSIPKRRVLIDGEMSNKYEEAFMDENNLCILISDKNIKFKRNLFA